MDWLVVWGVSNAIGFLFQPVMQQFAQDLGKDLAKDVLKDVLKGIPTQFSQRFKKEEIQITAGKAVREFLELVQNDLQDSGLSEQQIKQYNQPLKKFLEHEIVKELLGSVFSSVLNRQSEVLETKRLEKIWTELKLLPLPDDFNWKRLSNKYVIKVKEIVLASNAFRDIYNSYTLEKINENIEITAVINPGFDLYKYQEAIKEQYSNLKLESLDTSGCAYNQLKLWQMFIPQNLREVHKFLPQVHEIPKEHQTRLKETNQLEVEPSQAEWESHKQAYYRQSPHWVFEIWNDKQNSRYVVILGDPGSGKSTLLQYIALEWAESPVKDLPLLPIPLLIELRTYIRNRDSGQCKDFLEFFHKGGGIICRLNQLQLHELLKEGNAVVMFDGLDEVFDPAKREDVITDIHRFTNEYPQVRVIVTSRVIGYKPQRFRDAGFRHFMLQDLEPYQIDDFIHRWHELTFNDEAEKIRKRDRLQAAINTSSAIRELAGNPLLLTMMAILNRNQELPRDRPELYNQASRVLLHQWDVERALVEDHRLDPKTIDYKDKQAMLRHVAYQMQATENGLAANLIVANDLETILTGYLKTIEVSQARTIARLMREQLRTRNFILCFLGADYYAFVHRTFLEYFCAWEFVWRFKETQVLSIEQMKTEVFGKHSQDDTWQEVLRLIAGMIEPKFVIDIIEYLIGRSCVTEISINGINKKVVFVKENFMKNIFLSAKIISEVRNRSVISETSDWVFKEIQKLTKDESLEAKTRVQGVLAISSTWQDNPEALLFFKNLALSTTSSSVSEEAVMALATSSKENSEALFHLKTLAQSGNQVAIVQLAQIGSDDPSTLEILQTLAQLGNQTAMAELVRVGGDNPSSLPILKTILISNVNDNIKYVAIGALMRYWKGDPEILSILKKLALSGDKVAIEELALNWQHDVNTLSILKTLAQSGNVRAAIELLLLDNIDAKTLEFLKKAINSDRVIEELKGTINLEQLELILNDTERMKWTINSLSDLRQIRLKRRGIEIETGYFSTLRTKITNPECLKAALHSLGIAVKTYADVRGSNGQTVRSDIVAVLEGNYDIGWSVNSDGNFDLICDLWGLAKKYNQTVLINSINHRYAAMIQGYKRFLG